MRLLIDAGGARYGPYEVLVGADGARSTMGPATRVPGVRRLMLRTLSGKMFM